MTAIAIPHVSEICAIDPHPINPPSLFLPTVDRLPLVGDFITVKAEITDPTGQWGYIRAGYIGILLALSWDGACSADFPSCPRTLPFPGKLDELEVLDVSRIMGMPRVHIRDEDLIHFANRLVIVVDTQIQWEGIGIVHDSGESFLWNREKTLSRFVEGQHIAFAVVDLSYFTTNEFILL